MYLTRRFMPCHLTTSIAPRDQTVLESRLFVAPISLVDFGSGRFIVFDRDLMECEHFDNVSVCRSHIFG